MKPRAGRSLRWEEKEVALLKKRVKQGVRVVDIVEEINQRFGNGRTVHGTNKAIQRYKLDWDYERVQSPGRWSPHELAILAAYYQDFGTRGVRAVLKHEGYDRKEKAIYSKASRTRLTAEMGELARFKKEKTGRPRQKMLIARRILEKALQARQIVDLKDEAAEDTNIELSTFVTVSKRLIEEGIAIDFGQHLIALPIPEVHHD